MQLIRRKLHITGLVQGVGFRPFVYNLAVSFGLTGWVNNSGSSVVIEVEGPLYKVDEFTRKLSSKAPPQSEINTINYKDTFLTVNNYENFEIVKSCETNEHNIFIPRDIGICEDCVTDLTDIKNRRSGYPFTTCTNCGPRSTIIAKVPYDRINTSLNKFKMCEKCKLEYNNPKDRRYHAETISCFECGPNLKLIDNKGNSISCSDPIAETARLLTCGKIIVIKGIGGFHIACDAKNSSAVRTLRERKFRKFKPLAVMMKDYTTASDYCIISSQEKKLLTSSKKPIVLLRRSGIMDVSYEVCYNNRYIGIMLPYTAIQYLIFNTGEAGIDALVMTSGNISDNSMEYTNEGAIKHLAGIADYFLIHNLDILFRIDDTVMRVFMEKPYIIRPARGYFPVNIELNNRKGFEDKYYNFNSAEILACGSDLKNTFCISKKNTFYVSQYIGDLHNVQTFDFFKQVVLKYEKMLQITPKIVAYDVHPHYMSTQFAQTYTNKDFSVANTNCPTMPGIIQIPVQHHHAHMVSCMADNRLFEEVIGIIFDGVGYGVDGHLWGGEFLVGGYNEFDRIAHFKYAKMPGGDIATKQGWRMAISYLKLAGCSTKLVYDIFSNIEKSKIDIIIQMIDKNINAPLTSSVGRLFDAVSAIIGVCYYSNYEGQAAIELENLVFDSNEHIGEYKFEIKKHSTFFTIDVAQTFIGILNDKLNEVPNEVISLKFHETISTIAVEICIIIRTLKSINSVVLSGGVFQNFILLNKCVEKLKKNDFNVYTHSTIPTNDSGISIGQAIIAKSKS